MQPSSSPVNSGENFASKSPPNHLQDSIVSKYKEVSSQQLNLLQFLEDYEKTLKEKEKALAEEKRQVEETRRENAEELTRLRDLQAENHQREAAVRGLQTTLLSFARKLRQKSAALSAQELQHHPSHWEHERAQWEHERAQWEQERAEWEQERAQWEAKRKEWKAQQLRWEQKEIKWKQALRHQRERSLWEERDLSHWEGSSHWDERERAHWEEREGRSPPSPIAAPTPFAFHDYSHVDLPSLGTLGPSGPSPYPSVSHTPLSSSLRTSGKSSQTRSHGSPRRDLSTERLFRDGITPFRPKEDPHLRSHLPNGSPKVPNGSSSARNGSPRVPLTFPREEGHSQGLENDVEEGEGDSESLRDFEQFRKSLQLERSRDHLDRPSPSLSPYLKPQMVPDSPTAPSPLSKRSQLFPKTPEKYS